MVWLKDFGFVQLFKTQLKEQQRFYIVHQDEDVLLSFEGFHELHSSHWKIEKALTYIYNQREHYWQQSQEQADRTCASGYDAASRYLHQLFEAYQFKADEAAFEQRFKRFVVANNSRKALLNRLSDLL